MSLSEIIQKRFKKNIKVKEIWKPEDVEKFIIEKPSAANSESDFDGSLLQTWTSSWDSVKSKVRYGLENLILAQKSESPNRVMNGKLSLYTSNYSSSHGMSSYMVIPFWVSLASVLLLCCLGRCCLVPVVKACDYELNNRKYQRRTNKDTLIQ